MSKFDKIIPKGSVPNCQLQIANRYDNRWFKCKLKPPKNLDYGVFHKNLIWQNEVHTQWGQFWGEVWISSKMFKNIFYELFEGIICDIKIDRDFLSPLHCKVSYPLLTKIFKIQLVERYIHPWPKFSKFNKS